MARQSLSYAFRSSTPRRWRRRLSNDTLDAIDRQNTIMAKLSDEQRQSALDRQRTPDPESTKRAQEKAEEPETFDDFDQQTLVELAHVEHKTGQTWTEFTSEQIDELPFLEWLAGEIYDSGKPKSAKAREKNS